MRSISRGGFGIRHQRAFRRHVDVRAHRGLAISVVGMPTLTREVGAFVLPVTGRKYSGDDIGFF